MYNTFDAGVGKEMRIRSQFLMRTDVLAGPVEEEFQ